MHVHPHVVFILISIRGSYLYSADIDVLNDSNRASFKEHSHPLQTPFGRTKILGSCDGLLVLTNYHDNDIIVWNPSVRRFHEIPFSGFEFQEYKVGCKDIFYGFGYDVVSDDYKLIRIVQLYNEDVDEFNTKVKVYSLKSDSWRMIPDFLYHYINSVRTHEEFANGALHWIVTRKVKSDTNDLVAAFDLGTEEFRLVPLSKFAGDDEIYMNMVTLGGCLSLLCYANKDHVDIRVMKEYGIQESWSVLFTFDICDFDFMIPLAYSKCGRKVLLGSDDKVLMWYDLDKKSTDVPMVQMPSKNIYGMYTCLQSLVLLNNGTCDFDLVTKKKQDRKGQKEKL